MGRERRRPDAGASRPGRARGRQRRTGLGRIPTQLVFGDGSVWIASAVGSNGVVQQFDPETAGIVSTRTVRIKAGRSEDVFAPATPNALALAGSTLWSNALHSDLVSFDPRRRDGNEMSLGGSESVDGIASGYRDIWVSSGTSDRVLRIDPLRRRVLATIPIAAAPHARIASPYGIATGFGSVWVANALSGTVSEIDPHTNAVHATIEVGARPTDIAVGEGAVWVLNASDGTVTRIDPARHTAVATINVGRGVTGIAAGLGGVWVTVAGGRAAGSDRRGPNVVQPLPRSTCASLVHGAGTPDLLLASELPTFIEEVTPDAALAGVRAAILHVLRPTSSAPAGTASATRPATTRSPPWASRPNAALQPPAASRSTEASSASSGHSRRRAPRSACQP